MPETTLLVACRIDPVMIKGFDCKGAVSIPTSYMGQNYGLTEHNVRNLTFGNNRQQMINQMIETAWNARMGTK